MQTAACGSGRTLGREPLGGRHAHFLGRLSGRASGCRAVAGGPPHPGRGAAGPGFPRRRFPAQLPQLLCLEGGAEWVEGISKSQHRCSQVAGAGRQILDKLKPACYPRNTQPAASPAALDGGRVPFPSINLSVTLLTGMWVGGGHSVTEDSRAGFAPVPALLQPQELQSHVPPPRSAPPDSSGWERHWRGCGKGWGDGWCWGSRDV